MEIIINTNGDITEMTAPEGHYITQSAAVVDAGNRGYYMKRTLLSCETVADWRIATAEEREQYEQQTAEMLSLLNRNR